MGRAELRFLWAPIWPHSYCKCRLRLTLFGKFITLVLISCERKAPHNILFGIGPMGCKIWWENSWDMSFGPKSELQFNPIEFANLPSPILKPKCHFLTPYNEWMSSWFWPYLPLHWVAKNLIYIDNAFNGYSYLNSTRKGLSDGTLMLKKEYRLAR